MRWVVIAVFSSACSGKHAPTCGEAVEHVARQSKRPVKVTDGAIATCERAWTPAMRRCVLDTTTEDGLLRCALEHVDPAEITRARDERKARAQEELDRLVKTAKSHAGSGSSDPGSGHGSSLDFDPADDQHFQYSYALPDSGN